MKHEKTFETISKLKDIEIELHRLKNALEMANKALDAQRTWVNLTAEEIEDIRMEYHVADGVVLAGYERAIESKLRSKNI